METNISQHGATSDGTPNSRHEIPPPISQLPTELLAAVLHLALPISDLRRWPLGYGFHSYMPMLYTLRRVSKQWRDVIDGTPSFWGLILSTLPPHVSGAALQRSCDYPLTIVYEDGSKDSHPSPEDFLSTAVEALPRWLSYSGPVVPEYLQAPAPLMQNIALSGPIRGPWHGEPLELLGGWTAGLRDIKLDGVSIPWRASLFTQLKVLHLAYVGREDSTVGHILDFLRACPQLESLHLESVCATVDGAQSSPVVTLHHLKSIVIFQRDIAGDILRHIRAPSCMNFYLHIMQFGEPIPPSFLGEALHHLRETLHAMHVRNGSSELAVHSGTFRWHIPGKGVDGHHFFVGVEANDTPLACLRWVEPILQNDTGLGILFDQSPDITSEVLDIMAPMRCVTNVDIKHLRDRLKVLAIFQFISVPRSAGTSLPLPCLREVRLDGAEWNSRNLLDMVQSRSKSLSRETEERPLLTISMERGAFSSRGLPQPIVDYSTLTEIRETNGVERVHFVGPKKRDGMLAIIWNEELGQPTWG